MKKRIVPYVSVCLIFLGLAGCFSFYGPRTGIVVEKESGLPVEDAILVRSWSKINASVGGPVRTWLACNETVTDSEGKFSFGPRICFHGIPVLTDTEENLMLVYRPGYTVVETSADHKIITIAKVPYSKSARTAESNKVRSSYDTDLSKTSLLKAAVNQEEDLLKELTDLPAGILFTMPALNDIAIDNRGNIYLSNDRDILKLPRRGNRYDTANIGKTTLHDSGARIEIEIEHDQLYALQSGCLTSIDVSLAGEDDSPLATKRLVPGRGYVTFRRIAPGRPPAASPTSSRSTRLPTMKNSTEPAAATKPATPSATKQYVTVGGQSKYTREVPKKRVSTTPYPTPAIPLSNVPSVQEPKKLLEKSVQDLIHSHNNRFAIGADKMIHVGNSWFQTDGTMVDIRPIDVGSMKRQTAPQIVDTVTDENGNVVIAFYFPAERGPYRSGLALYDRNNTFLGATALPVEHDISGIAAAAGRYFACDRDSFYIIDKDFVLVTRQTLSPEVFGEYDLRRIKVDAAGENLFLVDGHHGRLLWYDLAINAWRRP